MEYLRIIPQTNAWNMTQNEKRQNSLEHAAVYFEVRFSIKHA